MKFRIWPFVAALLLTGCAERVSTRTPFVVTQVHYERNTCGAGGLVITRCTLDGYYCETLAEPDRVTGAVIHP